MSSPPPSWVEIRSAGGDAGQGVFAAVDIPKGTRIIAEAPLISVPGDAGGGGAAEFLRALHEQLLPAPDKVSIFDGLHCNMSGISEEAEAHKETIRRWYESNPRAGVASEGLAGNTSSNDDDDDDDHDDIEAAFRRFAIYLTNRVAMRHQHRSSCSVFPTYSRLNHSCVPNAYAAWNRALGRLTVHVGADVGAGAQVCISYTHGASLSRRRRAERLRSWSFECRCPACADPAASDPVRERIALLESRISEGAAEYRVGHRHLAMDLIRDAKALAGLFGQAGLGGFGLGLAYQWVAQYSNDIGNHAEATEYAKKNVEIQRTIYGEDGGNTDWIVESRIRMT